MDHHSGKLEKSLSCFCALKYIVCMAAASSEKITVISSPPQAKSTAISIAPDFLAILVPDSKSRWVDSIRKLMESFR